LISPVHEARDFYDTPLIVCLDMFDKWLLSAVLLS